MMRVADIQRFCMHDGPGVRTTVFFKGCPLSCAWCHNPETQSTKAELLFYRNKCIGCTACAVCENEVHIFADAHCLERKRCLACGACVSVCPTGALELCGTEYDTDTLLRLIQKDRAFFGASGGVTLSGGEPLMQNETVAFLKLCKEHGISTAVETCGFVSSGVIEQAVLHTDLFLWDIKDTDSKRHLAHTGVPIEPILQNLLLADALDARTRLRCILVNGVNTDDVHYKNLAELFLRLQHCEGIEFLPYHTYGDAKAAALGRKSSANRDQIPTREQLEHAKAFVCRCGARVVE